MVKKEKVKKEDIEIIAPKKVDNPDNLSKTLILGLVGLVFRTLTVTLF